MQYGLTRTSSYQTGVGAMKEKHFGSVWFIPGENKGRYPNCHSLYIEGPGIIIDPASDRKRLNELKDDPGVNEVWLSHWHEDHFLHLDLFDDLPLRISEKDAPPLSDLETFLDAYGAEPEDREHWRPLMTNMFKFVPRKPEMFLKDGDIFSWGDTTVEVIGTPGHTPGHSAFLFKKQEVLFQGDYDLSDFGPWYGDVESNIENVFSSIERLKNIPAKVRLVAHETGIFKNPPDEIWNRYAGVVMQRENALRQLLETPKTFREIVDACIVYGSPKEPRQFYEFGERTIMGKHLEKLINEKRVVKEDGKFLSV